jgi:hypothetical protein
MQQSQVDGLLGVQVFKEEDDLLDTVRDFSSAMYDNFHHLAPEIIERVRDIVRERRHRVHIVLGAVRARTSATFISSEPHPVKSVEWTIDSIKLRDTRVPDTYNDSENRLYTRADEDVGSAGHRMYM